MSANQTGSQPLAPVDPNRMAQHQDPFNPLSDESDKPVPTFADESKQHESLHSKLKEQEQTGKQAGTYVSPSDNIMSPASAKLNAFKEKRFAKSGSKPRNLFARTASMNSALQNAQSMPESKPAADKREQ